MVFIVFFGVMLGCVAVSPCLIIFEGSSEREVWGGCRSVRFVRERDREGGCALWCLVYQFSLFPLSFSFFRESVLWLGVRFSLIPLVFMQSTSAPRAKAYPFYRALYNFLDHPDGDFVGRLKVANKYMASLTLEVYLSKRRGNCVCMCGNVCVHAGMRMCMCMVLCACPLVPCVFEPSVQGKDENVLLQEYKSPNSYVEKVYTPIVVARRILAMRDDEFTLRAVRHANGNYTWRYVKSYLRSVVPDETAGRRKDPLDMFAVAYLAYFFLPLTVAVVVSEIK